MIDTPKPVQTFEEWHRGVMPTWEFSHSKKEVAEEAWNAATVAQLLAAKEELAKLTVLANLNAMPDWERMYHELEAQLLAQRSVLIECQSRFAESQCASMYEAIERVLSPDCGRAAMGTEPIYGTSPRMELKPCGEITPWVFEDGHYCGRAQDSIGICYHDIGCVLTRSDAIRLREFIQQCESGWAIRPARHGPGFAARPAAIQANGPTPGKESFA